MNAQQKKAKAALMAFAKSKGHTVLKISHVHAHAFFIGYAAAACGIFKINWLESEPQCAERNRKYPYEIIHNYQGKYFDENLKEGDACYYGYMSTSTEGTHIVCRIPNE